MRTIFILFALIASTFMCHAQIGYQVALINRASGEPRANEIVNVTIKITNGEGVIICTETKKETSNEFGILSMEVGSASTFADVDWTKLPFYIEATVDGTLIGKSQLLSVPVAEYAKHTDELKKELIKRTWNIRCEEYGYWGTLTFNESTATIKFDNGFNNEQTESGPYAISGYTIVSAIGTYIYDKNKGKIYGRYNEFGFEGN